MKQFSLRDSFLVFMNFLLMCSVTPKIEAQDVKHEFRSVWVATVANIDWPSKIGLSVEDQKDEVIKVLDLHKRNGMNAIILQVRPVSDAIYFSELEPWSRYLSGVQGVGPDPVYDPLTFWIEESHKRGMELHAWFNPYRVKQSNAEELAEDHIVNQHPDWVFEYGNKTYFEPGIPEVWEFVRKVVVDVVERYDIDAVHFDDYFYPYKISNVPIPDDAIFAKYGGRYYPESKDDWRRHNVDTIIYQLSIAIKEAKPWVKFGISPFGVWRNRSEDLNGSETSGGTSNYDGLYADVLLWQREGWIDYLMPQLYWREDHSVVPFSTLAYWWNDVGYGRSVYVGLGPYKLDKKSDYKLWRKSKYMLKQIDVLRDLSGISGYGMFSSKHFFRDDLKGLNNSLQKRYCSNQAIVPSMPWIDAIPPQYPQNLRLDNGVLRWDLSEVSSELDRQRFFVLYHFDKNTGQFLKSAENILTITGESFVRFDGKLAQGIYRVTALDRLNNESQLSDPLIIE